MTIMTDHAVVSGRNLYPSRPVVIRAVRRDTAASWLWRELVSPFLCAALLVVLAAALVL